ncbi:MAG TPA: ABC transporter substrate-binding protein [candidate division Zixibacteria bacterium]|nr:ABC transporter substrate-binding protein [candidate division Zixibacteria bacterium]
MKMNKVKTTILVGVMLTLFVATTFAVQPAKTNAVDPFFTLVFKTNGGGDRPDYGNFLKQHCARIGINVDVIVQDWPTFVGELIAFRDFDVCYVALTGGGTDPDFSGVYDENGSLNLFGYHTDMDDGLNEWYIVQGNLIMNDSRVQHYWDWEQYMMDKILPCQPTFAPKAYTAYWSDLTGYDIQKGIIQSWGQMWWDQTHQGQSSTDALVITDAAWSDFNPLFQDDTSSSFISGACLDTLIQYDPDLTVWPMLARSYEFINDTHMRFVIRDGVTWQDDPDSVETGHMLDARDVYFTLYAWAEVSNDQQLFDFIEEMVLVDDMTLDIYIDGDPDTEENEPYASALGYFWTNILPEHYLNQTQLADGVTPDITHSSWNTYSTNCFGTSLFEFGTFTEGVETTLTLFEDCWWLDEAITDDPTFTADEELDWVNRFGFGTTWDAEGMDTIVIRIIPDRQTALLEFEAGKVDLEGVGDFPEKRDAMIIDPDFEVQNDTTFYFGFFGYNMRPVRPVIGNPNAAPGDDTMTIGLAIRKAISYALDRVEINNVIHRGEYTITDHPIYLKMGIWCNPNMIRYNHDLDKARLYMEIAGYVVVEETTTTPGFGILIALSSIMAVASAIVIKKRK